MRKEAEEMTLQQCADRLTDAVKNLIDGEKIGSPVPPKAGFMSRIRKIAPEAPETYDLSKIENPDHQSVCAVHNLSKLLPKAIEAYKKSENLLTYGAMNMGSINELRNTFNTLDKETWVPQVRNNVTRELGSAYNTFLRNVYDNKEKIFDFVKQEDLSKIKETILDMRESASMQVAEYDAQIAETARSAKGRPQ